MSEMKQTGVKWIPEISKDFKIGYIKQYFKISKDLSKEGEPDRVLKLARSGIVDKDVISCEGQMAASYAGYNKVQIDDLLLNPMDLYSGANCNVSALNGVISPAYTNLRAKKKNTVVPKYYDYYFKCQYWLMAMFAHGKGVSFDNRWTLNNDTLKSYEIPVIPYEQQEKIVNAIENKEKIIESLISNQKKQIEKLKTYKQSLITEVVTKGLDQLVPMKDSGVEWIGKIPVNWSTIKIKYVSWLKGRIGWDGLKSSEFVDNGPYLITGTDFNNGNISWDTCVHISTSRYNEDELLHIREGDLLITKDGTIGKLAIVKNCPQEVSLNSGVMIIRNIGKFKYCNRFLYYILQSNQFYLWYEKSQTGNSTIRHLYQGQFYNFEFSYPSIIEQKSIANYLDKKCTQIDRLIAIKQQKIENLNQYKKSLIYEFVTGKKEVSNY